ncbi:MULTISPECIES: SDR family NAD(P)-dependent oxidoreductase [Actinomycetes]|uniref:SDR family NAD(P)-dependent oxidoreductase n=1 Tax=Actinomycetes TaxID=1760 RepID=UPI0004BFB044|nr:MULTISPECIES: SDR family NAD(P)-dependent oxidoreductase [Actinomycetes]
MSRGEQRVALVLGCGPDIGRACATQIAMSGSRVVCLDRDMAAAQASARACGPEASASVVDVTDRQSVRTALRDVVDRWGRIDDIVNVVGGSIWGLAEEFTDDEWDRSMTINLRQQWVVAQEAVGLLAPGGSVVAIASVSGLTGAPRHGAYGAAKAGLIALVKTLALENAARGIRINAIAPGSIATAARTSDDGLDAMIPMGRRGEPREIGSVAAFLTSHAASYITGQVLVVDGGASVKHTLQAV